MNCGGPACTLSVVRVGVVRTSYPVVRAITSIVAVPSFLLLQEILPTLLLCSPSPIHLLLPLDLLSILIFIVWCILIYQCALLLSRCPSLGESTSVYQEV